MRLAEQRFAKRRHASQTHVDARAEHVSKQSLVNVQVVNVSVVNSIEAADAGEPMVQIDGDLAESGRRIAIVGSDKLHRLLTDPTIVIPESLGSELWP